MTTPDASTREKRLQTRRIAMLSALLVFAALGLAAFVWWYIEARNFETTDNAYVGGDVVPVSAKVAGTVVAIRAGTTDLVRAGDELVALDPTDTQIALDAAEAELAQTVREVHSLRVANASLAAEVQLREANLAKAEQDLARRRDLTNRVAISVEELQHAETAAQAARSDLLAAREKLATNRALTGDGPITDHPRVRRAAAMVRAAFLDHKRTSIAAPVTGYVARSAVQLGQSVVPGEPLLAVVPLANVWVDANFQESQLAHMRIGQAVTLEADMYGSDVVYHGKVVGLGAGTGSAFSLLPAQNATGNWVKVVQRLPVRISLQPKELLQNPLRVGLSMTAKVDISDRSGQQLARQPRQGAGSRTDVYAGLDTAADQRVAAIIADNVGSAARAASSPEPAAERLP